MKRFVIRRLLGMIPTLLLVSFISFALVELAPTDPAIQIAGEGASAEDLARIREALDLNDPFLVRYGTYFTNAVTLDLGTSIFNSTPVVTSVWRALPVTLSLVFGAIAIAAVVSVPLAVKSASRPGGWFDRAISATVALGLAAPSFIVGLLLVNVFAIRLGWFPATGYVGPTSNPGEWIRHIVLGSLALSAYPTAVITRMLRTSLAESMSRDYARTAYAKGLSRRAIMYKHVLKNAAIPAVTTLGLHASRLIGGAVVVEIVFALPGLGSLTISAVTTSDAPVIQGVVLVTAVAAIVINLGVDLLYGYLNPKLRT